MCCKKRYILFLFFLFQIFQCDYQSLNRYKAEELINKFSSNEYQSSQAASINSTRKFFILHSFFFNNLHLNCFEFFPSSPICKTAYNKKKIELKTVIFPFSIKENMIIKEDGQQGNHYLKNMILSNHSSSKVIYRWVINYVALQDLKNGDLKLFLKSVSENIGNCSHQIQVLFIDGDISMEQMKRNNLFRRSVLFDNSRTFKFSGNNLDLKSFSGLCKG